MIGWNKLEMIERRFSPMDKLKSNRTITIKINGSERKYKESYQNVEEELPSEIIESAHSTELDGFSETAASQQAVDESFDWILPDHDDDEEDDIEEYIIAKKPIETKKKKSLPTLKKHLKKQHSGPIKSLFFSILLAIIIGTSFGFLVLKIVISDAKVDVDTVTAVPQETTTEKNNAAGALQPLQLQSINTFIVQGGVFSSVDSAKIEEQKVKERGIPTQIIEANGQAILVLGLADSIDKAKAVGNGFKENGIDVFAKPYALPEKDLKELTEVEANLLKGVANVYQNLASLSSSGILSEPVNETLLTEQKAYLQAIDKQEIKSGKIEQLRLELEGAITKIESFNQQQKASLIVDAQQHLLSFMGIYFNL
jgi:stage II sporulation protein B